MERRIHKRVYVNKKASMVMSNKSYNGYIVNASASGVSFMITSQFNVRDETAQNAAVDLQIPIKSSAPETLPCEIVWTKKGIYTSNTIALGMRILEPSSEYDAWIDEIASA